MDLSWILETLPVGLWVAHVPDGAVVYTNSEFRKILGVDAAPGVTIEGAPGTYGIFDRAGRPYPVERLPFSRVIQTGLPIMVDDIVIHRPDGRQVNVRAFGYPAFNGTSALEHVGVAFIDVSAEVKAQFERDQTLARLALAVNHAPIVIWSTNRLGIITLSEGDGLTSLGMKSGELVGTNVFELYKDHPTIAGYIRRGLSGESFDTPSRWETLASTPGWSRCGTPQARSPGSPRSPTMFPKSASCRRQRSRTIAPLRSVRWPRAWLTKSTTRSRMCWGISRS